MIYFNHTVFFIQIQMDKIKIQTKINKIVPDILNYIDKSKHKYYSVETNIRTVTEFRYELPKDDFEVYKINYARNQIFKNQTKIPVKVLMPDKNNRYVCQKSPLNDKSTNINSASKVIEPLNIGFDEYIKYIPINQDIPEGTVFIIDVKVPYDAKTRYRFKSDQLFTLANVKTPFDKNIDIGELDIGSEYTGKFIVNYADLNVYDSYSLFTFRVYPNGFDLITYEFMNVSPKYIIENVIKNIEKNSKIQNKYDQEFYDFKDDIIKFLKRLIESLPK